MGIIDFGIPSILISSVENAAFHKYVFASAVYVLKVSCVWSVHFLYSSAKSLPRNICLYSHGNVLSKIVLCMQHLMQTNKKLSQL